MKYILASTLAAFAILAICDIFQRSDNIRRVYPLFGRLPAILRRLTIILRLAGVEEGPFQSSDIDDIRERAHTGVGTSSFGTRRPNDSLEGRKTITTSLLPASKVAIEPITIGGTLGASKISIPIINFGALGFGPVNERVIEAFGRAASELQCLQNTGEDGLTQYHLATGARLVWQIGTGYWGCRDERGRFDLYTFETAASKPAVVAIELKLSQGAKPGVGGLMPAAKNTKRVAKVLGVQPGIPIVSPARHSAFDSTEGMITFLKTLSKCSGGLPIGLKLCLGSSKAAAELVQSFLKSEVIPDFISLDGAEGGTGAAPTVLQDHAGLPIRTAVRILDDELRRAGVREVTRVFAAGGIKNGFDILELLALGADGCFIVRAPLVAMGCVQARDCHTGHCPAGLTTHHPWRKRAVVPEVQSRALTAFYQSLMTDIEHLLRAAGLSSVRELRAEHLLLISSLDRPGAGQ